MNGVVFVALVLLLPVAAQSATPRDALVMAWNLDALISFDPAQLAEVNGGEILRNVCDPLVAYDRKDASKIVPSTAERWTVSPDGRTLTFTLRADLRFPSGKKATAHDAAWSLQRVVRLGFGRSRASHNGVSPRRRSPRRSGRPTTAPWWSPWTAPIRRG